MQISGHIPGFLSDIINRFLTWNRNSAWTAKELFPRAVVGSDTMSHIFTRTPTAKTDPKHLLNNAYGTGRKLRQQVGHSFEGLTRAQATMREECPPTHG